jgi:GDP-4-dehydro-6-deoxy-D-mannose reductase
MRILVTGITGFAGRYLAEHLVERLPDAAIWGLVRWNSEIEALGPVAPLIRFVEGDLADAPSLMRALRTAQPDVLFHLAAASTVSSSWITPAEVLQVNAVGQVHLLEALRSLEMAPRLVVACSGEEYGAVPSEQLPATEATPLAPVSPYGVSKAAQDLLAGQYAAAYAMPIVRLRFFNHTGPRRPPRFVASSFARQIAEIEAGQRPPRLKVGDLDVVRDFTDVRDVVRAYWLAASQGKPGAVYNVCSGRPVTIRQLLDRLLAMSDEAVEVRVDPGRLRTADIPELWGSHRCFTEATGWEPVIPLEQTLHDLLEWWRREVAGKAGGEGPGQ